MSGAKERRLGVGRMGTIGSVGLPALNLGKSDGQFGPGRAARWPGSLPSLGRYRLPDTRDDAEDLSNKTKEHKAE